MSFFENTRKPCLLYTSALEHERLVTASIDAIYAAAYEAKDFRAMQMLDWFIKEQSEEEKNAADLITKMELFGGDSKGLYLSLIHISKIRQRRAEEHDGAQRAAQPRLRAGGGQGR